MAWAPTAGHSAEEPGNPTAALQQHLRLHCSPSTEPSAQVPDLGLLP